MPLVMLFSLVWFGEADLLGKPKVVAVLEEGEGRDGEGRDQEREE